MTASTNESKDLNARHISPYTFRQKVGRMLWGVVQSTAFRCSWPTWYRYRAWLLRCFGANVAPCSRIRRTVQVTCPWNLTVKANSAVGESARLYCLGPITIGERVTISQHAHLCAGSHDYSDHVHMPLTTPKINVDNDAWIAADAFVGPGIRIGQGALLGARGCAYKDLAPWTIYGGNPARALKSRPCRPDRPSTASRS